MLAVRKKLQEFVGTIRQAQQAASIPKVELVCDPAIVNAVSAARQINRKAEISDLGYLAKDPEFLNKLQNQTNVWTRDISKVINNFVCVCAILISSWL